MILFKVIGTAVYLYFVKFELSYLQFAMTWDYKVSAPFLDVCYCVEIKGINHLIHYLNIVCFLRDSWSVLNLVHAFLYIILSPETCLSSICIMCDHQFITVDQLYSCLYMLTLDTHNHTSCEKKWKLVTYYNSRIWPK